MALCESCIRNKNCKWNKGNPRHCTLYTDKKETNFSRITASPEALAKWLEESIGSFCDTYNGEVDCEKCPIADDCDVIEQKRLKQLRDNSTDNISISDKDYWLAWLKQESNNE